MEKYYHLALNVYTFQFQKHENIALGSIRRAFRMVQYWYRKHNSLLLLLLRD
jgi:hypothetical protein